MLNRNLKCPRVTCYHGTEQEKVRRTARAFVTRPLPPSQRLQAPRAHQRSPADSSTSTLHKLLLFQLQPGRLPCLGFSCSFHCLRRLFKLTPASCPLPKQSLKASLLLLLLSLHILPCDFRQCPDEKRRHGVRAGDLPALHLPLHPARLRLLLPRQAQGPGGDADRRRRADLRNTAVAARRRWGLLPTA